MRANVHGCGLRWNLSLFTCHVNLSLISPHFIVDFFLDLLHASLSELCSRSILLEHLLLYLELVFKVKRLHIDSIELRWLHGTFFIQKREQICDHICDLG